MAQTQQYDKLDSITGADLANKIGWSTVGNAGATTGNFTLYNSSSKTDSNSIVGAYHKPANAATKTGANIARAWLTAGAGGILSETKVTVSVDHRISSSVNGSNEGWPTVGVSASDMVFGVILRANGTNYATNKWYEVGFSALSGQSVGTLIIRKVNAGSTTTLTTNGIGAPFKYPAYSQATTPANTPANVLTRISASCENSGGNVIIYGVVTVLTPGGEQTFVGAATDSSSPITDAGYGGFWASGWASGSGTAWSHFSNFLLTVNSTTASDPENPPEAATPPTIEADDVLTGRTLSKEEDSGVTPSALPIQPHYVLPVDITFETNELLTDAGYVVTQARNSTGRRMLKLGWKNLTDSDSNTLIGFFQTQSGAELSFTWSPPFYNSSARWIYSEGTFRTTVNDVGVRGAEAVAMEVFPT